MRRITVKWETQCDRCGELLEVGQPAMYEKRTGIFCVGCEPTEVEEIREYRQAKADAKAARYEEWAAKREEKASEQLNSMPEVRHDLAFITQPGRIPLREKMNQADDRAYRSLKKADKMKRKAESLRKVRVKGDAERKRQAEREILDKYITKGSRVVDIVFGKGTVVGVYKKSYRVKFDRTGSTFSRDKSYFRPLKEEE